MDIEVEETYRRRGIAAFLTEHMLSSCSEENLTVQWDCVESNTASRMAAENAVSIYSRNALIIGLGYRNLYME